MTPTNATRRGATLIELLVVIAILTALLALALMIVPTINNTNATGRGAGEIQAGFDTARGMAARTRNPCGVRFIVNSGYISNEIQFIELPPVITSDPQALVAQLPGDTAGTNTPACSRVELSYTLSSPPGAPAPNTITNRVCV